VLARATANAIEAKQPDSPPNQRLPSGLCAMVGLENIRHEATAEVVRGGSAWTRWWQQTLEAIREWEQAERGLTEAREKEYKALLALWIDPFWFLNAIVHAC
jgi:hypothetical protein